jgi:hypothetical protein
VADPIEQGTLRDTQGGKEVWDGEKWLSPLEAVEEYGCSFEEVGELVREEIMGGGGAGPGEYTVSWRIWQVGDKFVLDMTEDGLDYQVCDDLADCEATWHDEAELHYPEVDEDEDEDQDEDEDDEEVEDEEEEL